MLARRSLSVPLFKRFPNRKLSSVKSQGLATAEEAGETPDIREAQVVRAEEGAEAAPDIPAELPILPLRGAVVYPGMWLPLTVGQARSIRLIDETVTKSTRRMIGLATAKNAEQEEPAPGEIYGVGVAAIVHR